MFYLLKIILTNFWRWRRVLPPVAKTLKKRQGELVSVSTHLWVEFKIEGGKYSFEYISGRWEIEFVGPWKQYNSVHFLKLAEELKIGPSQVRKQRTDRRIFNDLQPLKEG
jgi:hypothetical protein